MTELFKVIYNAKADEQYKVVPEKNENPEGYSLDNGKIDTKEECEKYVRFNTHKGFGEPDIATDITQGTPVKKDFKFSSLKNSIHEVEVFKKI